MVSHRLITDETRILSRLKTRRYGFLEKVYQGGRLGRERVNCKRMVL